MQSGDLAMGTESPVRERQPDRVVADPLLKFRSFMLWWTMRMSLITVVLLLLVACSGRREDGDITPKVHPVEISGKTADSIFIVSRVIDLETTPESLIAFPFDLCVNEEEIFVASRNNEIKVFDMEGKYKRSIGRLGDGPGEYRTISSVFPHGSREVGVYDWSNLRLTLFSREGEYRMSAVLGMPGMEGVRSVLFVDGSYYLHLPSSPAQNYQIVRMDTNLAITGGYVETDRRYSGYQDRLLFNGGIVMDSVRKCIYEADSYFYGIRCIDPVLGNERVLGFEPPSFYIPIPTLNSPSSMDEALTMFQKGTNVYNMFMAAGRHLILEYHQAYGRGRVKVLYLIYDLNNGTCFTMPAGEIRPSYSDGEHLYALIYHDKNSRPPGEMVMNPSLIVYDLSIGSQ
jgi:hypothetical protein